jgi:hypothetical protein
MPWLYHIYAGHDNNRDSYIANLIETQHLTRLVNKEWYPVILFNHHQTAPFPARIWTPPNSEPTNPNIHPLIVRWQNLIGYPEENPLMSGWIYGDRVIRQKAAILDIPYGKGKIILLGFPVQFRAQSYGTFRLLFNSIFYAGVK